MIISVQEWAILEAHMHGFIWNVAPFMRDKMIQRIKHNFYTYSFTYALGDSIAEYIILLNAHFGTSIALKRTGWRIGHNHIAIRKPKSHRMGKLLNKVNPDRALITSSTRNLLFTVSIFGNCHMTFFGCPAMRNKFGKRIDISFK